MKVRKKSNSTRLTQRRNGLLVKRERIKKIN